MEFTSGTMCIDSLRLISSRRMGIGRPYSEKISPKLICHLILGGVFLVSTRTFKDLGKNLNIHNTTDKREKRNLPTHFSSASPYRLVAYRLSLWFFSVISMGTGSSPDPGLEK